MQSSNFLSLIAAPDAGVGSIKGPPFMSAADDIGDSSQPLSPSNVKPDTGKSSTLDTSAGMSAGGAGSMSAGAYRPRCGRASAEFLRGNRMVGQVTQLGQLYAPTQQAAPPVGVLPQGMQGMLGSRGGMVGNLPYGGIGQIPEHSEGQMSHSGQYVPKPQSGISGPINRLIGPLPTSHETAAQAGMQYGVGAMPAGMTGFVGQYPTVGQVGQVHNYPSVGSYQMHPQQAAAAYSAGGSIGQMDNKAQQFAYPNGFGVHQRAAEARQLFQQQRRGPPVSHIGATQNLSDGASGRNVGEISQQSLANSLRAKSGAKASGQESPRSRDMSQVLHYLTGWQAPQHRPPEQYYHSYPQQHAPADLAPDHGAGQGPQPSVSHPEFVSVQPSPVHAALPLHLRVPCGAKAGHKRRRRPSEQGLHAMPASPWLTRCCVGRGSWCSSSHPCRAPARRAPVAGLQPSRTAFRAWTPGACRPSVTPQRT